MQRVAIETRGGQAGETATRFWGMVLPVLPRARRAASRLCGGDAEEAEDLVHEALLRTYGCIRLDATADPWPLLARVLRTAYIDRRRRSQRTTELNENTLPTTPSLMEFPDPGLQKGLDGLEPDIRDLVTGFYGRGLTHAEAAKELGITEEAAKQRLKRARQRLRQVMEASL